MLIGGIKSVFCQLNVAVKYYLQTNLQIILENIYYFWLYKKPICAERKRILLAQAAKKINENLITDEIVFSRASLTSHSTNQRRSGLLNTRCPNKPSGTLKICRHVSVYCLGNYREGNGCLRSQFKSN